MKFRTDFVTNSSSSSFIFAKRNHLNEKQKEAVIAWVENLLYNTKLSADDYDDPSNYSYKSPLKYEEGLTEDEFFEKYVINGELPEGLEPFDESEYDILSFPNNHDDNFHTYEDFIDYCDHTFGDAMSMAEDLWNIIVKYADEDFVGKEKK